MTFKNKKVIFTAILLIVIFMVPTIKLILQKDYIFTPNTVNSFNDGWTYNNKKFSFDTGLSGLTSGQEYTIENTLPDDYKNSYELLIRSSLADIKVMVDGNQVYSRTLDKGGIFQLPNASLWHLVDLPNSSNGKTLAITFRSPYKSINGMVNPIVYGTHSDLLIYILSKYGPNFALNLIILLLGFSMVIISLIMKKDSSNSLLCIGIFGILISLWLIAESKMLQFFTGSQIILGSLAYVCLPVIPIPLLYYIKNLVSNDKHEAITKAIKFSWLNLALVLLFQSLDIFDFFETVPFTQIYILFLIVFVLRLIRFEITNNKNSAAKNLFLSIILLSSCIMIEIVKFYIYGISDVTVFVRLGLLLFISSLSIQSLRQMIKIMEKSYNAEFYKKLAYMDQLTHGENRMAFEKNLSALFQDSTKLQNLRLVFLDMDNLKLINDKFGHTVGDAAIKNAYKAIDKSFKTLGKSYRIGGDEFAVIIPNSTPDTFNHACKYFRKNMAEYKKSCNYPFGIALGSVTYEAAKDTSAEKMIHRADKKMYQEKIAQCK